MDFRCALEIESDDALYTKVVISEIYSYEKVPEMRRFNEVLSFVYFRGHIEEGNILDERPQEVLYVGYDGYIPLYFIMTINVVI